MTQSGRSTVVILRHYEADIPFWPEWRSSEAWRRLTPNSFERRYWDNIFQKVRSQKIVSWAYPWTASVWFKGGLTATPNENLVSNIGFGAESTHTVDADSPFAEMATYALTEITHPPLVLQDVAADQHVYEQVFRGRLERILCDFLGVKQLIRARQRWLGKSEHAG